LRPLLTLSILFSILASKTFSQSDSSKSQSSGLIPKIDVFWPIVGVVQKAPTFGLLLEKKVTGHISLQLGYYYYYQNQTTNQGSSYSINNFSSESQVTFESKYYFSKTYKTKGFYAGLFLEGAFWHYIDAFEFYGTGNAGNINYYTDTFIIGALAGYQNFIRKRIAFDFAVGAGMGQVIYNSIRSLQNYGPLATDNFEFLIGNFIHATIGYKLGK
jgi:hypothetical protein